LQLRAGHRGLDLPDETAQFLLNRSRRDMASLYKLLDTLDDEALRAQRRLTIPFVRDVINKLYERLLRRDLEISQPANLIKAATSRLHSQQTGHFPPSWLATLRFTSVGKRPIHPPLSSPMSSGVRSWPQSCLADR